MEINCTHSFFPSPFAEAATIAEILWNKSPECPFDSNETVEDTPLRITCHPKWNSKMRSKEFGCLEFGVVWHGGDTTVEPIWNLIDIHDKSVTEVIIPVLRFYTENTKTYPKTKRQCWFCRRYCSRGEDMCSAHSKEADWIYSSIAPDALPGDELMDPLGIAFTGLWV